MNDELDRSHDPLCDWNLPIYRGDRAEIGPKLCNLDCVNHPDAVAEHWATPQWRDVAEHWATLQWRDQ